MKNLPAALAAMNAYSQFIIYNVTDKTPLDYRTGRTANPHDPQYWTDFSTASAAAERFGSGVGFVLTAIDPFWFLDIDKCLIDGQWSPLANELCLALAGAAVEVSLSQRGLHLFGVGTIPPHGCKNVTLGIELYTERRYVALTGCHATGDVCFDASAIMPEIVAKYFPPDVTRSEPDLKGWTTESIPGFGIKSKTDDEFIAFIRNISGAGQAFGSKASIRELFDNDEAALAKIWGSPTGDVYDRSQADASLASHLIYYTGGNCERTRKLMERSALVRDKWVDRDDYLRLTILNENRRRKTTWFVDKQPENNGSERTSQEVNGAREIVGTRYADSTTQRKLFDGCVYILDENKIYIPFDETKKICGRVDQGRFRAAMGGYSFVISADNGKTTKSAWEAFTESQLHDFPKVQNSCFDPTLAAGQIVVIDGLATVNTYRPLPIVRMSGDIQPFLDHIALLLPDVRDQVILISFLAALVQYPGVKFSWCIVLQGVQGNGKSWLTNATAAAIGRTYVHIANASEIGSRFNGFLNEKVLIIVEEMKKATIDNDPSERLKVMISELYQEIEEKGCNKIMRRIPANFIINTNYKDSIKKTEEARRYCVFHTAQQTATDLKAAGMEGGGVHFTRINSWQNSGGQEALNHFLMNFDIPDEFNPAKNCRTAPETSSTAGAICESHNRHEQEILEMIAQGRVGFRGGWIARSAVDILFQHDRLTVNKRRDLIKGLGYEYHPGLTKGRAQEPVLPSGNNTELFIKIGHPHAGLTSPAEIARTYTGAQQL